eukprot:CFRG4093T1
MRLVARGAFTFQKLGSAEDWRDDFEKLEPFTDRPYPKWKGEYLYKEPVHHTVHSLMEKRFDKAKALGCYGIQLDNTDQIRKDECYLHSMEARVRERGLAIAYTNNLSRAGNVFQPSSKKDVLITESIHVPSKMFGMYADIFSIYYTEPPSKPLSDRHVSHFYLDDSTGQWQLNPNKKKD